jgi:exosortase/archaeosortase family protein
VRTFERAGNARISRRLRWLGSGTGRFRFLILTLALMIGFYAVLYHPYEETSFAGRMLIGYLRLTAVGSGTFLGWLGEPVSIEETSVLGRFPFVVVLDCAALDAQALFAAAVIAFPVRNWHKLVGLAGGLAAIWLINVGRLVALYFAGTHSRRLFEVLHEEVMVLVVIVGVCGLFLGWASWARRRPLEAG